jgi:hypothetical protein
MYMESFRRKLMSALLKQEVTELILKLNELAPDLLNLGELERNCSLLPVVIQKAIVDNWNGYINASLFENNRVPNDLVIKAFSQNKSASPYTQPNKSCLETILGYKDIGLLRELAKKEELFLKLIEIYPKWWELIGADTPVEAIKTIILSQKKPSEILNHLSNHVYLDEGCIDLFIEEVGDYFSEKLIGKQILTEQQLITMEAKMYKAWPLYPLSDPDKYRPNWTNKGDPDMIGPNMPDEWAQEIMTSKKDVVIHKFAKFGPKKFLPLLIGRETKRWSCKGTPEIIHARLSGNKEAEWTKVFSNRL